MTYKLRRGDTELIAALARGSGTTEAGLIANVHPNTVRARYADRDFMREVSIHRSQFLTETAGILARVATKAATRLEELIIAEDTPDHVVQNACRTVLDFTMRLREGMDLDDRIVELEELVEQEFSLESSYSETP